MPLKQGYTTRNGDRKGYFQWGKNGKKHTYEPGNDDARRAAKSRARRDGKENEPGG